MITRRKDYAKRAPSKDASKIYIVCEGAETEKKYFSFFEGLSSNLQLIIIPPEEGTDPLKLMELAKRVFHPDTGRYHLDYAQNDKVWFAIDTDTWENEGKIMPLRAHCMAANSEVASKGYTAWNVAQSNPCFEIWLYYHHYDSKPNADDIEKAPSIKAYVDSLIAGGFDFQNDPVRIKTAIENAERNFKPQPNGNPDQFSTEQYLLANDIYRFVSSEVRKLRNKMM